MNRRRFLAGAVAGLGVAVAGCTGDGAEQAADSASASSTPPPESTATATRTPEATLTSEQMATATETAAPPTEATPTAVAGDPASATVELTGNAFTPLRLSVEPPATVEWLNRDPYVHNVKSATFHDTATAWDYFSGNYAEGESVTYTFRRPGVYEYFCTIHGTSTMCGAILVGDVTLDEPLPCE